MLDDITKQVGRWKGRAAKTMKDVLKCCLEN